VSAHLLTVLAATELRLRLRRVGSAVAVLAAMALAWTMIADPATGRALIVVNGARAIYDSGALALGGATLASMVFGLGGFYLVRGRVAEDLRSGAGGVIGASMASNALLVAGRWLGAVVYLAALALAMLATVLALHLVRGESGIDLSIYLPMYALVLLPCIVFAASAAMLCEAVPALMGKTGDVLYFILWVAQSALLMPFAERLAGGWHVVLLLDFGGLATTLGRFAGLMHVHSFGIGATNFDAALPLIAVPAPFWTAPLVATRLASMLIAALPLLPAIALFHRFSPDRVKRARAARRASPFGVLNRLARPLAVFARPLHALALRTPGAAGRLLAEAALTLGLYPSALAALPLLAVAGWCAPAVALPGVALALTVFWAVLIGDSATRDDAASAADLVCATGGAAERHLRHAGAALLLGLAPAAGLVVRWSLHAPLRAAALVAGLFAVAACATLLGRLSGGARTFTALFFVALYAMLNARGLPVLDAIGFSGAATAASVQGYVLAGAAMLAAGCAFAQAAAHRR
jgi:hypothetical protein